MAVKDLQGRDRPERKVWVFENFKVEEKLGYGSNDEENKGIWFVPGVGSLTLGLHCWETRDEALKQAKRSLKAQILQLQGYLNELEA